MAGLKFVTALAVGVVGNVIVTGDKVDAACVAGIVAAGRVTAGFTVVAEGTVLIGVAVDTAAVVPAVFPTVFVVPAPTILPARAIPVVVPMFCAPPTAVLVIVEGVGSFSSFEGSPVPSFIASYKVSSIASFDILTTLASAKS